MNQKRGAATALPNLQASVSSLTGRTLSPVVSLLGWRFTPGMSLAGPQTALSGVGVGRDSGRAASVALRVLTVLADGRRYGRTLDVCDEVVGCQSKYDRCHSREFR